MDNEIIKALKELLETGLYEGDLQGVETISNALDLINRQKAESEYLNKEVKFLSSANENLSSDLTSAKAEIERLKDNAPKFLISDKTPSRYFKVLSDQPILIYPYNEASIEIIPSKETIRAEAIKEFAERLKECTYDGGSHPTVWDEFACAVDNLVKEMLGEQE